MPSHRVLARRVLVAAIGFAAAGAAPAAQLPLHHAHGAHAVLVVNRELLAQHGVTIAPEGEPVAALGTQYRAQALSLDGTLDYGLEDGHFVRAVGGELSATRVFTF